MVTTLLNGNTRRMIGSTARTTLSFFLLSGRGGEGCSECTSLANSCCFPAAHGHFLDNSRVAVQLWKEARWGRGSHSTLAEIYFVENVFLISNRDSEGISWLIMINVSITPAVAVPLLWRRAERAHHDCCRAWVSLQHLGLLLLACPKLTRMYQGRVGLCLDSLSRRIRCSS